MKKLLVTLTVILLVGNAVVAQNKYASDSLKAKLVAKCDCSKLVVYPYFYYESPNDPTHSNFRLRFDFQHKGNAICIPEFKGTITIVQGGNKVKLSVSSMRSVANTQQTRIFTIPQSQIPFRIQIGLTYSVTYSLNYGTGICPASSTKTVRFEKDEPLL